VLHLSVQLLDVLAVGLVEGLVDVVVGLLLFLSECFKVVKSSDN